MTIVEWHTSFKEIASRLGDYNSLTKEELANGYCDADEAGDVYLREAYWSALMLRYWYKIFRWKASCSSLNLTLEDYVGWLHDALTDAFYYRSWRKYNPDGTLNPKYQENDPFAADRSINFFCAAKRGKEYQFYNKDNRKSNVLTYSIDAQIDDNGDCALDYAGLTDEIHINGVTELVNLYLTKNRLIEALIIDGVNSGDCFKTDGSFDTRKLVKYLNSIDRNYLNHHFINTYEVDSNIIDKIYDLYKDLTKKGNVKLYKYIEKTFLQIATNKELLSYLQ